mmetsp:Transcript_146/g.180  ORF Transcript_146/g.180 Transcript_146/m.180 type:complete len:314 (-) Transcript_146:72-1013(-)|eukprot:CAMPEP_0204916832 /NCGR_PEP_ID=MMETSP1397-20131031/14565_1 /ASSEMBLY_ACC=CAM_ASM_000891 /TAXON_ID=49980 /ORGANISM="Climacostomum Climacostomum virens, Strain Stock W-24" /LENGTH=313 /DNA_ID=CAMNT_0052089495 /DNA_START=15 /DNA_END=956 /DNA_ORIENTATION=+
MKLQNAKCQVALIVLFTCVFVIGFTLWLSIYLSIFYPFIARDFRKASCNILNNNYNISTSVELDASDYYDHTLLLDIDGQEYTGHACQSDGESDSAGDFYVFSEYPYNYFKCEDSVLDTTKCAPDQLYFPRWFCESKLTGPYSGTIDCYWHLYKWDYPPSNDYPASPNDIVQYPQRDEDFLEILFSDSKPYDEDGLLALWIIPFGLAALPSFLALFFCMIPLRLGWCNEKNKFCVQDFFERLFCCRWRRFTPRWFRKYPPKKLSIELFGPWLFALKRLKKKDFHIPKPLIREIASYISSEYGVDPSVGQNREF